MFDIYLWKWAKNYDPATGNYTLVNSKTQALHIPVSSPDEIWLTNPTLKVEVNKAESFDFGVDVGSKYYNAFLPYQTWIEIEYGDECVFWGLVKSVANSTILQKRQIHAEGVYTVFQDTPVEGIEEDLQGDTTINRYLNDLLENHNRYVEDDFKKFRIGQITIPLKTDSKKRWATSWTTTMSELDKLVDESGGYIRARHDPDFPGVGQNGTLIEWAKYYFRDLGDGKRPAFKLTRNIIELSKGTENNDIFTRVIPIGHKTAKTSSTESSFVYLEPIKYMPVSETFVQDEFRSAADFQNAEKNYGVIYKTVNFSNASTSQQLREYCTDWIKNNYFGIVHSFTVKGIDLYMIGERQSQVLVGDAVDIVYREFDSNGNPKEITRKLICKAIQYNLLNPEANTYTLGIPCDAIDFEYGSKAKKTTTGAASAAESARVSSGSKSTAPVITWKTIRAWLYYYYYTIRAQDIVDWTETRWAEWDTTHTYTTTNQRDKKPYNSAAEYVRTETVDAGTDEDGNQLSTTQRVDVYLNFRTPGGGGPVKGRIMGHYTISSGIAKPTAAHKNGFTYGVCLTDDGHVYTFSWNNFLYATKAAAAAGDVNSSDATLATYFEIARVANGKISEEDLLNAAENGENEPATVTGPTEWLNYDGKKTAEIGAEEGWSGFGFITGDDGELVPVVKINDTVKYIDANGEEQEASGFITARDLNLPEIPSFTTKIASMDYALINRATIGELRAALAVLGNDENYGTDSYELDANGNPIVTAEGKWKLKQGTKFVANVKNITSASGLYYTDDQDNLIIKDGAGFKIEHEGVDPKTGKATGVKASYGVWDEGNLTGGIMAQKINGQTETYISGDKINIGTEKTKIILSQATDQYNQLVGQAEWRTDSGGKKYLLGWSAGMQVWDSGRQAAYGIYHNGNLDGGIIVKKINNETTTQIRGKNIQLGSTSSTVSLADKFTINSNGYVTSTGSMWVQGDMTVSGNGGSSKLTATNIYTSQIVMQQRNATATLDRQNVANLLNTSIPHVKITGPVNDEYTLWYLPVSTTGATDWIKCQTFSHAANLYGTWSGGGSAGASSSLYIKTTGGQKTLYAIKFGSPMSVNYNDCLEIYAGETANDYFDHSTKKVKVTVALKGGTMGSGASYGTTRYSKILYVDATPAYNGGWDDACKKVELLEEQSKSAIFSFKYPISLNGSRAQGVQGYTLASDNDTCYVKYGNRIYAQLNHGKYTAGRNYQQSITWATFAGSASLGWFVAPYQDTSAVHETALVNGRKQYKLGTDSGQTQVQIQDTSGNKLPSTPTYTIPTQYIKVTERIDATGTATSYSMAPTKSASEGLSYAVVTLNTGTLDTSTGKRTITVTVAGQLGTGGAQSYKTLTKTVSDYNTGKDSVSGESHTHAALLRCTQKTQTYPGSSIYNYTFTCNGASSTLASAGGSRMVYW